MVSPVPVLVAYATAAGSTRGVAECIADELRAAGHAVTCAPASPDLDPGGAGAVVVGSAVHNQRRLPGASAFLARLPPAAGDRRVWAFSVGGLAAQGPVTRRLVRRELETIAGDFPPGLVERDHPLFRGLVDPGPLPLAGRLFWRVLGGHHGDQRDWPAIRAWARSVHAALAVPAVGRPVGGPGRPAAAPP
jgi:menaquinone-dependent protoporphyrinogen oxidase